MPRLDQLQQSLDSPALGTHAVVTMGEETLIIDERSRRSPTNFVEEKLTRLTEKAMSRSIG